MSKKKKSNPNPFRQKWDMPHATDKEYRRSKVKQEYYDILEEDLKDEEEMTFFFDYKGKEEIVNNDATASNNYKEK